MLVIRSEQRSALIESHLAGRILSFLKRQLPEKCNKSDAELLKSIKSYIEIAREQGIRTERSIAKLSYLLLLTDGTLLDINGVKDYLSQSSPTQDDKVDRLIKSMAVGSKIASLNK